MTPTQTAIATLAILAFVAVIDEMHVLGWPRGVAAGVLGIPALFALASYVKRNPVK